jgi:hypothetical protein
MSRQDVRRPNFEIGLSKLIYSDLNYRNIQDNPSLVHRLADYAYIPSYQIFISDSDSFPPQQLIKYINAQKWGIIYQQLIEIQAECNKRREALYYGLVSLDIFYKSQLWTCAIYNALDPWYYVRLNCDPCLVIASSLATSPFVIIYSFAFLFGILFDIFTCKYCQSQISFKIQEFFRQYPEFDANVMDKYVMDEMKRLTISLQTEHAHQLDICVVKRKQILGPISSQQSFARRWVHHKEAKVNVIQFFLPINTQNSSNGQFITTPTDIAAMEETTAPGMINNPLQIASPLNNATSSYSQKKRQELLQKQQQKQQQWQSSFEDSYRQSDSGFFSFMWNQLHTNNAVNHTDTNHTIQAALMTEQVLLDASSSHHQDHHQDHQDHHLNQSADVV